MAAVLLVLVVVGAGAGLGAVAIWPPNGAPKWWRRWTRPLRHRMRRGHYGGPF